ncbi:MAG TPA: GatB/YqeY domain-containing protein [Prolixibacteraceae bacterium]|nr:GatB/YqeY domain-containing protein [Prolixibacteraceae bacterium]
MTLFEQINEDIKAAMKAREKERLEALRNLKKLMLEARAAKGAGSELSDDESLKLVQKLVKQGRDSAEIYREQNREDLFAVEMAQVEVLETYLPKPLTDAELTAAVRAIVEKTGATSIKEMGKVMGIACKELAGKADGKDIADKVKALLS